MGDEFTLEDAIIIAKRRIFHFLIPVVILAPLGVLTVMLLPAKYTAQGTILVESAQIPSDLVRSTIQSFAQERIEMIKQRVMTRDQLLKISDKYELFPKKLGLSETQRVERMRKRLNVSLITAQGGGGRGRDNTIAFNVSYIDRDPIKAYKVANEFMSLFLTEDVRTRTAGASNTTEFFKDQTKRLAASVAQIDKKIADYKEANSGALPEQLNMHLNMLTQATNDLATVEGQIVALDQDTRYVQSQLAAYLAGAGGEDGPAKQLAQLKAQLTQLRSIYTDQHPNVKAVKDQIAALEAQMRPSREIQELQDQLTTAELALDKAEKSNKASPGEIADRQREVERLQNALSAKVTEATSSGGGDMVSAQLQSRLAIANSKRAMLEKQREELKAKIADLQGRIARTPEVERGLQALMRDYDNTFKEYQEVLSKQQDAQLAENLEDNQKAEKFSILDPAVRPEKPSSPQRVKLSVLAIFAAFGAGGMTALGFEFLSPTVRGRAHFEKLMDAPPIAVIPNFPNEKSARPSKKGRKKNARGGPAAAAAAIAALAFLTGAALESGPGAPAASAAAMKEV